jgi:hypothetical protein
MIRPWRLHRTADRTNYSFVDRLCSPGVIHKVPSRPAATLAGKGRLPGFGDLMNNSCRQPRPRPFSSFLLPTTTKFL